MNLLLRLVRKASPCFRTASPALHTISSAPPHTLSAFFLFPLHHPAAPLHLSLNLPLPFRTAPPRFRTVPPRFRTVPPRFRTVPPPFSQSPSAIPHRSSTLPHNILRHSAPPSSPPHNILRHSAFPLQPSTQYPPPFRIPPPALHTISSAIPHSPLCPSAQYPPPSLPLHHLKIPPTTFPHSPSALSLLYGFFFLFYKEIKYHDYDNRRWKRWKEKWPEICFFRFPHFGMVFPHPFPLKIRCRAAAAKSLMGKRKGCVMWAFRVGFFHKMKIGPRCGKVFEFQDPFFGEK